MTGSYAIVCKYEFAGLTLIPIRDDGSKAPAVEWKQYRERKPTDAELRQWFAHCDGIALVCGAASGGVEVIDFDDPAALGPWADAVQAERPGLLQSLPISRTPSGGTHIFYRCEEIAGNLKLAQRLIDGKPWTMIETRGEGGIVVIPPTPARYHLDRKPYRMLRHDLTGIPTITPQDRAILLDDARLLNRYVPPTTATTSETPRRVEQPGDRPGDVFNGTTAWAEILEPHGWTHLRDHGSTAFWRRPGKAGPGCSATTNTEYSDVLYVFSSNAYPFDPDHSYSKFGAWAILNYGADYREAARFLSARYRAAARLAY
jgi:putative DNA primase/helicase